MTEGIEARLAAAEEALERGDWPDARELFEAALADGAPAEAELGLGVALMWLGQTRESLRLRERAYAAFVRRPDPAQAAFTAIDIALTHHASLDRQTGARGWLARARGHVEEHALEPLEGWLSVAEAAVLEGAGELAAAQRMAERTRAAARAGGDRDLELCALSLMGSIMVRTGRVEEGLSRLDEAMAGSLAGEGDNLDTVVFTSCTLMSSCAEVAEFERVAQWKRAADDFHARYGSPHLYTRCRLHYAAFLVCSGDWQEAESEIERALEAARTAEPGLHAEALASLAGLRLRQGRLEEAERLLEGLDDPRRTATVRAGLLLARGETGAARAVIERALRANEERPCVRAELLELRAEASMMAGSADATASSAQELAELGKATGLALIEARAERALGRAGLGEEAGRGHLERALERFGRLEMPYEVGLCHLRLAELEAQGDAAVAAGAAALERFNELGASHDADRAASLLRSLGERPVARRSTRAGGEAMGLLSSREGEVLSLLGEGLSNRAIAERLFLSHRTVEHHVRSIRTKLGLKNRSEAAAYAVRHLPPRSEGARG